MTLAVLGAPRPALVPAAPRPATWTGAPTEPLAEPTPEQWDQIHARLRAAGLPDEPQDDRALARTLGASFLLGLGLTGLMAYGLWSLLA